MGRLRFFTGLPWRSVSAMPSAPVIATPSGPVGIVPLLHSKKPVRWAVLGALLAGALMAPAGARAAEPAAYRELVGAMHEHSGYSDGYPGSTPGTYYASAKRNGIDFLMSGEHSDNYDVPVAFNDECLDPTKTITCPGGGEEPAKALRKWDETATYARAATDESFTGVRGFEWTSDRYGHLNTYFSRNFANAKGDGGYATMQAFWQWFLRRPELGGGGDGLGTFNHPDDKKLQVVGAYDPDVNWENFAYVPAADDRMVAIELFNTNDDYDEWYPRALDKGWHLGAVGAEDLGHKRGDDWGGPQWAKTVILATDRSEGALYEAMLARRFYAVRTTNVRMTFGVDGEQMGSRLVRVAGQAMPVTATVNDPFATVDLITSGGRVVASGVGSLDTAVTVRPEDRYYFVRARNSAGRSIAYSSPVWVSSAAGGATGQWLAGDLHVHTCYSHDGYCAPGTFCPTGGDCPSEDYNTTPDEFYVMSGGVEERFIEASLRGLDYLAITDHHSDGNMAESGAHSWKDPGFGTHGVIGVPGYENSISGHAQMLGARKIYPARDGINAMADALRADGGVFQANHPADGLKGVFSCDRTADLHWKYGYDVRVDTVEVWNISHLLQPPAPAGTSNEDAIRYWECWLQRGEHVGATGGSDSHWISTAAVQGPGNPTTWVFSRSRSAEGILGGLREGRTSVSLQPPVLGTLQLVLEADVDGDGTFEAMIGDTVPAGVAMRVRAEGLPGGGLVEVRAGTVGSSIATLVDDEPLAPGSAIAFRAPTPAAGARAWVRATLRLPDAAAQRTGTCDPLVGAQGTYCRNHILTAALTSPIYVAN